MYFDNLKDEINYHSRYKVLLQLLEIHFHKDIWEKDSTVWPFLHTHTYILFRGKTTLLLQMSVRMSVRLSAKKNVIFSSAYKDRGLFFFIDSSYVRASII